ncbi:hypothetical protein G6F59_013937 [Rhizopus arrhizus]|nr:hypothetical protein G6F59_013937 [Rhizopus arrhizus]
MQGQVRLLKLDPATLDAHLDQVQIDPGFTAFVARAEQLGLPLRIVSDGLDYAIHRILANHGLSRLPVVANHLNIPKPPAGQPTLLTWDEVNTTFHEFGHALHGMFYNVNEMWSDNPAILKNYAKHYQNGSAMPQALLDKVLAAAKFNQGFATTEYLGAAMLDQRWHQIGADQVPAAKDVMAFERAALEKDGIYYAPVPPRYKPPYFSPIMGGYSAGYYAYIWSEVLDANTQKWFKDNGGLSRKNGDHFRATLLSKGGSVDAMQLFRDVAGQDPQIEPLLEKRGLTGAGN